MGVHVRLFCFLLIQENNDMQRFMQRKRKETCNGLDVVFILSAITICIAMAVFLLYSVSSGAEEVGINSRPHR